MAREVLTFYTPYSNFKKFTSALKEVYAVYIKDISYTDSIINIQLENEEWIYISYATNEYNTTYLRQKLIELFQIVDQRSCENIQMKDSILQQILLFQGVYEITFTYESMQRKDKIVSLMEIADKLTALILWETQDLSNSFGDILLSYDGKSEITQFYPIDEAALCMHHYDLTDEQLLRMHRSIQGLRHKGIYAPSNLEVPHQEKWRICQDKREIIKRCLACMITAMYAEALLKQKWTTQRAYEYVKQFIQLYDIQTVFSAKEIEFLSNVQPSEEECDSFYQGYEHCNAFLWILGLIEHLPFPDKCVDSSLIPKILMYGSIEQIEQDTIVRPIEGLLDEMDILQRYYWSIQHASHIGLHIPAHLNKEVVRCRYHAWKWIVNKKVVSWDDVDENMMVLVPN